MSTKRLFLAIPLDESNLDLCDQFLKIQGALPVKWVARNNWHITTIFLGDFPVNQIDKLLAELQHIFSSQESFEIEFDKFCLAPDKRNSRMIWAKYQLSPLFDNLVHDIFSGLKSFYKKERLEFNIKLHKQNIPHVTLSRLRSKLMKEIKDYPANLKLKAISCILFESVLKPDGAQYLIISEFPLINRPII